MTSLLAFAWRRAQSVSAGGGGSGSSSEMSPDILAHGVSVSSSSDTLSNPVSSDSLFAETSCFMGSCTPDALRRRKSPAEIRDELGLAPKQLIWPSDPPTDRVRMTQPIPVDTLLPPMTACLPSSQVSTSSIYSKRSVQQNVARSPSLKLGEAKTAVGALLARNESRTMAPTALKSESTILPCRAWLQDDRSVDEANDFSIEMPYEPLNDSKGCCFSSKSYGFREDDEESSIHASPSSHRGPLSRNLPNTSFTRGFLEVGNEDDRYDFHPIVDKELIVSEVLDPMNMSCISQSTAKEMESLCSMGGDAAYQKLRSKEEQFRSQNERRIKEDLLLSTLERFQDDNEIVVEAMDQWTETHGRCDGSTRPGRENLLDGFSEKRRMVILKAMDEQLSKWRSTPLDPVDMDLLESLAFCRSLVHASVPLSEKLVQVQWWVNCRIESSKWNANNDTKSHPLVLTAPIRPLLLSTVIGGDIFQGFVRLLDLTKSPVVHRRFVEATHHSFHCPPNQRMMLPHTLRMSA